MKTTVIDQVLQLAEDRCQLHGANLTVKRKLVLRQLIETRHALSAYEIAARIQHKTNNQLPVMSVYRMLDFLASVGLVHKIESQNKYVACRHISCDQPHQSAQYLICQNCDYIHEIDLSQERLGDIDQLAAQESFSLSFSVIEYKGLCHECQQTMSI